MAYQRTSSYRYVSNSSITSRYRQLLILIGAIIFGMIISATVNAIPSSKGKGQAKAIVGNSQASRN